MERAYERSLGTALLAIGLAILVFGFYLAYEDIQHLPSGKSPTAHFDWSLSGLSGSFTDGSDGAGATISTYYWTFGDNSSASTGSPGHTFPHPGGYTVTLQIQTSDGASAQTTAQLQVQSSGTSSGSSSPSGPVGNQSNIGSLLGPVLGGTGGLFKTVETFVFLIVFWLVGGAILRAGWNLITPKAETISVRVKPRSLQVEPVTSPAPAASAPAPPPTPGAPPGSP